MRVAQLLSPNGIVTGIQECSRDSVIGRLVALLSKTRGVKQDIALHDINAHERSGAAVLRCGQHRVALPHAVTSACNQLMVAVATCPQGIAWNTPATPKVDVVFLLLVPSQTQPLYLRVLSRLAHLCEDPLLVDALLAASCPQRMIDLLAEAEQPMGELAAAEGMPTFCVLGAGPGGMAMAGHLALTGCKVNLYSRSPERIDPIRIRGGIDVTGEVQGFAALPLVTTDAAAAVANCDVVMVVTPATAHRDIAMAIAPHLKEGQIVLLNPGRTGGALELAQVIRSQNPGARAYLAEAQSLLYAARVTNPGQVHIHGIKNSVPLATLPAHQIADVRTIIAKALPQFVAGDNILKTSLDNIGAVFHPAITMLNAARIEDTHGEFQFYVEGVTPAVAEVLEAIDCERVAVAAALGIRANTAREWLYLAYNAAGKTLLEAMRANPGYNGIKAPATIQHRYITEDVPTSLVPIASIGQMLGVGTPIMQSMIRLASIMHNTDYWAQGRTVDKLGIAGMSVRDIRFLVVGAEPASSPPPVAPGQGGTASNAPSWPVDADAYVETV